jgi:hypothetical protein
VLKAFRVPERRSPHHKCTHNRNRGTEVPPLVKLYDAAFVKPRVTASPATLHSRRDPAPRMSRGRARGGRRAAGAWMEAPGRRKGWNSGPEFRSFRAHLPCSPTARAAAW